MKTKLKLIAMSEIQAEEVKWLWYPYIPFGKITIIQGDPGEGKTTFVLALTALLTRGLPMPGGASILPPTNIIYQTAEDGLADTIKPRLDSLGADCSRVLVIDESERELTLNDHRLAQAIQETGARLVVLDPLQAYPGDGVEWICTVPTRSAPSSNGSVRWQSKPAAPIFCAWDLRTDAKDCKTKTWCLRHPAR